ncbi:MAG: hypothetical protein AABW59_01845 [archaeon]
MKILNKSPAEIALKLCAPILRIATEAGFLGTKIGGKSKSIWPKGKKPKICIVYLVSPRKETHTGSAMKKEGISKLDVFTESLKSARKFLPEYPVIIFHEDYTKDDFAKIRGAVEDKKITFAKVDFDLYKRRRNLNQWLKESGAKSGRPAGYQMMCRFFCGVMQSSKQLAPYDYYIRLDHDSFFIEPKKWEAEKLIEKNNFDYMYRSIFRDPVEIESLWKFTKKFAKDNSISLDRFKQLGLLDKNGNYNGLCPYTNFHMAKLDFWKRKDVRKYLNEIEKMDGILKLKWDDATIQAMLLGLFDPVIIEKTDFGYRHNFHYSLQGSLRIRYIQGGRPNDWP